MGLIKTCPYCGGGGNRIGCDYCDESGLMDLNEIALAKKFDEINSSYDEDYE